MAETVASASLKDTRSALTDAAGSGLDPRRLRDAFGRFATGVAVVTTLTAEGKREGVTVNSFTSVSLDPALALYSLRNEAPSLPGFRTAPHFAVSVLSADQIALSNHFARPRPDKFAGIEFEDGIGGCPLLKGALASFECAREQVVAAGDHTILIGRILRVDYTDQRPLLYVGGQYSTPVGASFA